jgi:hypothetical protein
MDGPGALNEWESFFIISPESHGNALTAAA